MSGSLSQDVAAVLQDAVAGAGLVLEDVEVASVGRRRVVRVVVDLPAEQEGDVDLDAVAVASTAVSAALDASDVLGPTPYVLEVSSPGVDRPLVQRRHWARARGRLVRAVLADGRTLEGRVLAVSEEGVLLDVQPQGERGRPPARSAPRGEHLLAWAELVRGQVQVEFSRLGADAGLDEDLDEDGDLDEEDFEEDFEEDLEEEDLDGAPDGGTGGSDDEAGGAPGAHAARGELT
ncbi:ribosome maturation factor RimP [Kineococcus glutinatus]|uniref:ribosome maturation factor RimP n=1 Tax=Kineococcus glutinatus TaxID=1070872 RepID=UPI0031EDC597